MSNMNEQLKELEQKNQALEAEVKGVEQKNQALELKVQALLEKISNIVARYENQEADYRVEITLLASKLKELDVQKTEEDGPV